MCARKKKQKTKTKTKKQFFFYQAKTEFYAVWGGFYTPNTHTYDKKTHFLDDRVGNC
jgi:hypothetical protein